MCAADVPASMIQAPAWVYAPSLGKLSVSLVANGAATVMWAWCGVTEAWSCSMCVRCKRVNV